MSESTQKGQKGTRNSGRPEQPKDDDSDWDSHDQKKQTGNAANRKQEQAQSKSNSKEQQPDSNKNDIQTSFSSTHQQIKPPSNSKKQQLEKEESDSGDDQQQNTAKPETPQGKGNDNDCILKDLDESKCWDDDSDEEQYKKKKISPARGRNARARNGQENQNISSYSIAQRAEIQRDKKEQQEPDLSKMEEDIEDNIVKPNRGNRENRDSDEDIPKRGNRRGNRDPPQNREEEGGGFRKKPSYAVEHSDPRSNYRGGRGGRGDNRGDNRGGDRGRDNREGDNRPGGYQGYPSRGGYGERGNRGGYQNNHYHNNNYNRNDGYQNPRNENRNKQNYSEEDKYVPRGSEYGNGSFKRNEDRSGGGFYRGADRDTYQNYEREHYNQQPNVRVYTTKPIEPEPKPEPLKVVIEQPKLQIKPRGQKCWPEVSMYVHQKKLSFAYRQIAEHIQDVLIIPYKDLMFEVYPGNLVNKFKVNYRTKIENKGSVIKEVGTVYLQRCVGFENFQAIGFLYLGENKSPDPIAYIKGIFEGVKKVKFSSVLIPYSAHLGEFSVLLNTLIDELGTCENIKQVAITTNNGKDFQNGSKAFVKLLMKFIDENKFCIEF